MKAFRSFNLLRADTGPWPRNRPRAAAFFAAIVTLAHSASGQGEPASRRVTTAGAQVRINQIETSQFPRVIIFATVLKDGEPVPGLAAVDFRVREDEVDQEPITVVPKLTPLSVVLTLDTSGSMKKRLADAQAAAKSFIGMLAAEDKAGVIRFSRDVKTIHPLGGERAAAAAAIEATVARGDTALWDALDASLESLAAVSGRKAVVLLSDGVDDDGTGRPLSRRSVTDVLALARKVNAPIYAIGIGTELDEVNLRKVAVESGAAYFNASQPTELRRLYDSIGRQLAGQYTIYYQSNLPVDGAEHRVQLKVGDSTSTKAYLPPVRIAAPKPVAAPPAPPAVAGTPISGKAPSSDIAAPVPLELGGVVKGRLDDAKKSGKSHYWHLDFPAGTYKLVIDLKRVDDADSNLAGELDLVSADGRQLKAIGRVNVLDTRRRSIFKIEADQPLQGILRYSNTFTIADYQLGIFRADEPMRGIFFLQPPPVVPVVLGQAAQTPVLDGLNTRQSDIYFSARLPAGDYKVSAEFRRVDQARSNVGGKVLVLGSEGETKVETLLQVNELGAAGRKSAKLSLADDTAVTFKLRAAFAKENATFLVENWSE